MWDWILSWLKAIGKALIVLIICLIFMGICCLFPWIVVILMFIALVAAFKEE